MPPSPVTAPEGTYDAVLIGAGIMSATLATLLHQVQPDWRIAVIERLDEIAGESTGPWNNAGTGHAALCEMNYTPQAPDGTVCIDAAVKINAQFHVARQLWAHLVTTGALPAPDSFIHPAPHLAFVTGSDVDYLRRRHEAMTAHPLFAQTAQMTYTEDPATIADWAPLVMGGRDPRQPVAATRSEAGTDVDFGVLTRHMLSALARTGTVEIHTGAHVSGLARGRGGDAASRWRIRLRARGGETTCEAGFVFVGAGGGALPLLQSAGLDEVRGYGGFPVSGQFWRTTDPSVIADHHGKVYGRASAGAPPMSVPHLDARLVEGQASVVFGPFAGFSPRFLKHGSLLDLARSVRGHNLTPMLSVGAHNTSLLRYLAAELAASRADRAADLRTFYPQADPDRWEEITAGQRVQVIKRAGRGGVLQFGTEVVAAADGSIAGLLGASPGASVAAPVMLEVLARCFPERVDRWRPALQQMIGSYGTDLARDPDLAARTAARTAEILALPR